MGSKATHCSFLWWKEFPRCHQAIWTLPRNLPTRLHKCEVSCSRHHIWICHQYQGFRYSFQKPTSMGGKLPPFISFNWSRNHAGPGCGRRTKTWVPDFLKWLSNLWPKNGTSVKNDNSLLFKKLKELNSIHRIIMTGVSYFLRTNFVQRNLTPSTRRH